MKHPIRRRLMYLGFQGLRTVVQMLPLRAARAVGRGFGTIVFIAVRSQRQLTLTHLRYAFGESLSLHQCRMVARGVFRNLGQNAMEWLLLPKLSSKDVAGMIQGQGIEHVRNALAEGNGAIVITPHFGNWELIAIYLRSFGFEGGVLARRLRYPEYESFLISMRGAKGVPTFVRGSIKEVAKVLRANQIIGILPDQDTDSVEGIFVDFFGHPAYTPVGPAALSMMTGAPIIPCFMIRDGLDFRLVIEPPLRAARTSDDRKQALKELTQAWSAVLESYVRRYPDHWVWMHRRWKTKPRPDSNPEPQTSNRSPSRAQGWNPVSSCALFILCGLLCAQLLGCAKSAQSQTAIRGGSAEKSPDQSRAAEQSSTPASVMGTAQRMSAFTLTGYEKDGKKRWELHGETASIDGDLVKIRHPDAKGYDPVRTAYLTAEFAEVNQKSRHVRLEREVTVHTTDGFWLTSPVMHWMPDQNRFTTDDPVRIETDHMLLRGRGANGLTQLKHATILRDIELVLNPSDHELPVGGARQVTITCDGPLSFDYDKNIAIFEQQVHIKDPQGGDLYSDKLVAYLDRETRTIRYAEATGNVRIEQQENSAVSDRAIYEPAIGKITLVGKPSVILYPQEGDQGAQTPFGDFGASARPRSSAEHAAPESAVGSSHEQQHTMQDGGSSQEQIKRVETEMGLTP